MRRRVAFPLLFPLLLNMSADLVQSGVSPCTHAGSTSGRVRCRLPRTLAEPRLSGSFGPCQGSSAFFVHRFRRPPGVGSPQTGQARHEPPPRPRSSCRAGGAGQCGAGRAGGAGQCGAARAQPLQAGLQRSRRWPGEKDKATAGLPDAALRRRLLRRFKSKGEVTGQSSPRLGCRWQGAILLTAPISVYLIATWLHVPVEEGCRSQANL